MLNAFERVAPLPAPHLSTVYANDNVIVFQRALTFLRRQQPIDLRHAGALVVALGQVELQRHVLPHEVVLLGQPIALVHDTEDALQLDLHRWRRRTVAPARMPTHGARQHEREIGAEETGEGAVAQAIGFEDAVEDHQDRHARDPPAV